MADMIKFYKGLVGSLPAQGANGALYITTDEGAIYLGTGTGMKRLGDFVQVESVASLPTEAHESCLYYCVAENILAKWNGTEWKQINKQPTAEELKTLLGLGTMAYLSQVSEANLSAELAEKVNASAEGNHAHDNKALLDTYTQTEANLADAVAKKHEHANAAELAKIVDGDKAKWDAVAADHLTSADKTTLENSIKEAKKAGTDANTALETYKVSNDARVLAVEEDISEIVDGTNGVLAQAKSYSDGKLATARTEISAEIDADVKVVADDLAAYKTSNDTALAGVKATAEAAATKAYTDAELAKKVDKVEGYSLVSDAEIARLADVTNYDDTQVKADIAKKADAATMTTELGKKVDKAEGYSLVSDTEIARLADVDNYDDAEVRGLIGDNADAIDALAGKVGEVPADKTVVQMIADAQTAATYDDEEVRGLISDNADAIDAIEADYLKAADKTELSNAIAAEKERAEGVEGGLETRLKAVEDTYATDDDVANLQTQINTIMNNPDAEGAINSINEFTQYIAEHGEIAEGFRTDIDKNKEDIAANAKAISDEAVRADAAEKALSGRIDTLEAIDHEAYKAADATLKTELEGKAADLDAALKAELQAEIDTDIQVVNNALEAYKTSNNAAVALKANAADVYSKTETFTKEEVAAAIAAAIEAAHTWGEF